MGRWLAAWLTFTSTFSAVAQVRELPAAPPAETTAAVPYPQLDWKGDLRLRLQSEKNADNENRVGPKIRLRFGVVADFSSQLQGEVRLATAKSNRSPNQSLGDTAEPGSTRHFVGLDLGYVRWKPFEFISLYGGRMPQLHFRPGGSQILLDEGITLEGAGFTSAYAVTGPWSVFLNGGSVSVRENYDAYYSSEESDNQINWMQLRTEVVVAPFKLIAGGGFFNFTSMRGKNFADLVAGGTAGGNSEDGIGVVRNPFLPKQYFLEASVAWGSFDLGLFGERIINAETRDPNSAWWLGINLGQKRWDTQVAYCDLRSDAVPSVFTYSDFSNGTTDTHGWVVSGRWKFAQNMSLKLTQFVTKIRASTDNKDYHRRHVDLNLSF